MHLGYHELRKLLEKFNEQRQAARMGMNGPRPVGGPAPSAPRGPISGPPSGPSAPRMGGPPINNGFMAPPPAAFDEPMTPTGQIGLPVDMDREADSAIPGHGDKKRREAMELQQDSRHERSRDDDRYVLILRLLHMALAEISFWILVRDDEIARGTGAIDIEIEAVRGKPGMATRNPSRSLTNFTI